MRRKTDRQPQPGNPREVVKKGECEKVKFEIKIKTPFWKWHIKH